MREIPLTKGYTAKVDDEDYDTLVVHRWMVSKSKKSKTHYAVRSAFDGTKWINILMHRDILDAGDGSIVDHADGNGLNNQRANIRLASFSQNMWNQGLARHNTSGTKGVNLYKRTGKWRASIKMWGTSVHLGYFRTKEEATSAWNKAARLCHGKFFRNL